MHLSTNRNLYFSYGSNSNIEQMSIRCPNAELIGAATLKGWRLAERTHADIHEDGRCKVHGVLWKITPACLRALDRFEGYPNYYTRSGVQVRSHGRWFSCFTYWMADTCPLDNRPFSDHYAAVCIEGALENGVPLDPIYRRHQKRLKEKRDKSVLE